jgi:DNA helicase-2/ATP-dependent DNA helicase PcrA
MTFKDVAQQMIDTELIKGKKAIELQDFINIFNNIDIEANASTLLQHIINATEYIPFLKDEHELEEAESRIENINEFLRAVIHFQETKEGGLSSFLDEVALLQEQASKQDEQHDTLMLMTLHAAKGLEFDTVILAGLEEGLLPSTRSLHDSEAIEEERRLFYVGITRARERLLLSRSRYRYSFGQMNDQYLSRFLQEIPDRMYLPQDLCYMQAHTVKHVFSQWLGTAAPEQTQIMTFGATSAKRDLKTTPTISTTPTNDPQEQVIWKLNQPVKHKTFGIGLIKKIEGQGSRTSLTVYFGTQAKKVLASFVTKI